MENIGYTDHAIGSLLALVIVLVFVCIAEKKETVRVLLVAVSMVALNILLSPLLIYLTCWWMGI